jgi:hypothetical protein
VLPFNGNMSNWIRNTSVLNCMSSLKRIQRTMRYLGTVKWNNHHTCLYEILLSRFLHNVFICEFILGLKCFLIFVLNKLIFLHCVTLKRIIHSKKEKYHSQTTLPERKKHTRIFIHSGSLMKTSNLIWLKTSITRLFLHARICNHFQLAAHILISRK